MLELILNIPLAEEAKVEKLRAELKEAQEANTKQEELHLAAEAGEFALSRKLAYHKVIHRDLEKELVKAMSVIRDDVTHAAALRTQLQELRAAATEVVDQLVPEEPGHTKSLISRLQEAPGRVKVLLSDAAKACAAGLLTTCRLLYPTVQLEDVAEGVPENVTDAQVEQAQAAVEPLAEKVAGAVEL